MPSIELGLDSALVRLKWSATVLIEAEFLCHFAVFEANLMKYRHAYS